MGADLCLAWAPLPRLADGKPAWLNVYNADLHETQPTPWADRVLARIHANIDALTDGELNEIVDAQGLEMEYALEGPVLEAWDAMEDSDEKDREGDRLMREHVRKELHRIVDHYLKDDNLGRDTGMGVVGEQPFIITGGMSWGDSPTDSFDDINLLSAAQQVTHFTLEI